MKKIIPTLFAAVLAISSVSLLIGCSEAVPDDPDAGERGDSNKLEGDDMDANTVNSPDGEAGTGETPPDGE